MLCINWCAQLEVEKMLVSAETVNDARLNLLTNVQAFTNWPSGQHLFYSNLRSAYFALHYIYVTSARLALSFLLQTPWLKSSKTIDKKCKNTYLACTTDYCYYKAN